MDGQYVFRWRCDAVDRQDLKRQDSFDLEDDQDSPGQEADPRIPRLTGGTIMTSANIIDILKVDNNQDTLCRLPPTSQLLGPQNPQFRATQTTINSPGPDTLLTPDVRIYNGNYPTLGLYDHNERETLPTWRDPNKHKLWAPSPDTMVDDDGNVVQYYVNKANIDHATRYYQQQALGAQSHAVNAEEEQSWTRQHMARRLTDKCGTKQFAKKMKQVMEREDKIGRLNTEDAANVLKSIAQSHEVFAPPPSLVDDASDGLIEMSKATSFTAQPQQMNMSLAEFEASLKDGLSAGESSTAPNSQNEIVLLVDKVEPPFVSNRQRLIDIDAPGSYERTRPHERSIVAQRMLVMTRLVTEQEAEGLQPMRRILRRDEDLYDRDNYPSWALRTDKKGKLLLPDQETQDLQRKVMAFSMRLKNYVEDQPLETGLDQIGHLLEPAWAVTDVDSAEEFNVIQSEPNVLCKLFDEPERPIGAFDTAEVDYFMERERQKHLKHWRKRGYSEEEINGFQQEAYNKTPAELDARGKAAKEAMIAGRKLLVIPPLSQQSAPSKKRKGKQALIDSEDDFGEGPSGLRRSKRAKTSKEEPEEISPATVKRLDDELDQLSNQSDDQAVPPGKGKAPIRSNSQGSNTSNGSGSKRITLKFDGKAIRTMMYNPPSSVDQKSTGETTEDAGEETEDAMDLE